MLKDLSLWGKKDSKIMTLSGGMKRRLLIAKALSHEPQILFLDEPTAGVDVELRRDMWALVRSLQARGVTIILTTHYIDEAEEMADRVGVISKGEIILVENKSRADAQAGQETIDAAPARTAGAHSARARRLPSGARRTAGSDLIYTFDAQGERPSIAALLEDLDAAGIRFKDLQTTQSSLEDIFVSLVREAH